MESPLAALAPRGRAAPFRFEQPIRFSHCDPAAALYFPHVFDFVNAAMESWFAERLGLPFHVLHLDQRRGNPVLRTQAEFLAPCRFGETLALALEPVAVGASSIETRLTGTVEGAPRFRVRHKTAMMSMETMRAVALPDEVRARALAEVRQEEKAALRPLPRIPVPSNAFRSRKLVRYAHCDPGERVYFARFFDMFNAALEDWFARALGAPWESPPVVLGVDAEFVRACVLGEVLDLDLWVERLDRSSFDLALAGSVGGQPRLRAAWKLRMPTPAPLRAMERFLA